jgi:hypothetical protein
MSTLSALEIADLIKEKAMALTKDQPVDGYEFTVEGETENIWIIAQADFDYQYGALVQVIYPSNPRPYIMIWWHTVTKWDGDNYLGADDKTEVEWIHNFDDSVSWTDAISKWGGWIEDITSHR